MRDPAIHIRMSDLKQVFRDAWELEVDDSALYGLFKEALNYSIRNRVMVVSKSASKKKIDRHTEATTNLVADFNRIYQGVVVSNNIKAMAINKSSVQYLTLTEVTHQAIEFCDLFELGYENGFKIFVETGLDILKHKFNIYRLKGTASRIVDTYRDKQTIINDSNPAGTNQMIKEWGSAVKSFFDKSIHIDNPEAVRVHFIHAREDADSVKANYGDWMYAQFEKWQYLNSIPQFTQLYGDNAKLVYGMYIAKVGKTTTEERNYFNKSSNVTKEQIPTKASVEAQRIREARLQKSLQGAGPETDGGGGAD